ncbi:IucA/IucC family protein [Streptomyces sp. NPDC091281]|uniref:IucA/IucC family protein n=1 Tax=Streptomyces sp. NPDC091281 TaxID=3365985 RepID=UPI00380DC36D
MLALAPLLNCLIREVAVPLPSSAGRPAHRLPSGRELRVRGTRRPAAPEVRPPGDATWRSLDHDGLIAVVAEELRVRTGVDHPGLPAEMRDSRHVLEALLAARAEADAPADPYLVSEQSLLTGHPYHPAPKTRGGGAPTGWLPYAPEACARFPLTLLAVREDQVVEEGDTAALDTLGEAPPGYRLLPAHPWQLALLGDALAPAFADGRLVRVGGTSEAWWPTAAVRTVYAPERDLFLKFSLDVRITNDVRRLWRHDLLRLRRVDAAVSRAFAAADAPADGTADGTGGGAGGEAGGGRSGWLSDRGYRTARFAFEELAVMVRDGLHAHVAPGATPLLAAALAEGFDGNPLATTPDPAGWWKAYLAAVVPPALTAFDRHGVVVEAHLQNTLVTVSADGTPVQALYRDAEGVKLVAETGRAAGWERLVYCLVVNHLLEIAAALTEHHPGLDPWPPLRAELARHTAPEAHALLTAPTLPGKTNLLLRWTDADGADARYLPLGNVLTGGATEGSGQDIG